MTNNTMKAFWLGLFIMGALAIFVWMVLFLKPGLGDGRVTLKVRFSNIDRISQGTRVTFAGKAVGEVVDIKEIRDPRIAPADGSGNLYMYELTLKVDSSVKVFTYDEIVFASSGLLGEKSIAIIPKAPPPGGLPAQNVTHEVLYAYSADKIEQTLNKLVNVAGTFENTLGQLGSFLQSNHEDFNRSLKSFSTTSDELQNFMRQANQQQMAEKISEASNRLALAMNKADDFLSLAERKQLAENMGTSFASLAFLTEQLTHGEGTIGQLIHNDCLYLQFSNMLCQLKAILDDISNYGLLYQFDRKWQRMHDTKKRCHRH